MMVGADFSTLVEASGLGAETVADRLGYPPSAVYRWMRGNAPPRAGASSLLKNLIDQTERQRARPAGDFTFIDLFAGIGGMRLGFEAVGGDCVFTSEWNKYSQLTYYQNFGAMHEIEGDIRQVPAKRVPNHDVLLAGFPCQPFSLAGVSKKNALNRPHGFDCETQGTLFFDVERIIAEKRPKAFLLENVKNLRSHDEGRTFEVIRHTLKEKLGYHVSYKVIDAKSFVPQHRERIFIVGFRDDTGFDLNDLKIPPVLEGPRLASILHREDGSEREHRPYIDETGRISKKYTLSATLWQYLQDYAEKHRAAGNGFGFGLVGPEDTARTLSARYHKDGSEILVRRESDRPRRLTPRECARLMGFDRSREDSFRIPVSDTQAYRQFGNAVVVPVVETIAKAMRPYLVPKELKSRREANQRTLAMAG